MQEDKKDELQAEVETDVTTTQEKQETEQVVETPEAEGLNPQEPFKTFENEEEFNKVLQSTSSKAKGEILKELGINSVNAFKEQFAKVSENEEILTQLETLKTEAEALTKAKLELEDNLLTAKYGLTEDSKDLFINMVRSSGSERALLDVAEEVYQKLQGGMFKNTPTKVVFGADKTEGQLKDSRLSAFERGLGL